MRFIARMLGDRRRSAAFNVKHKPFVFIGFSITRSERISEFDVREQTNREEIVKDSIYY